MRITCEVIHIVFSQLTTTAIKDDGSKQMNRAVNSDAHKQFMYWLRNSATGLGRVASAQDRVHDAFFTLQYMLSTNAFGDLNELTVKASLHSFLSTVIMLAPPVRSSLHFMSKIHYDGVMLWLALGVWPSPAACAVMAAIASAGTSS